MATLAQLSVEEEVNPPGGAAASSERQRLSAAGMRVARVFPRAFARCLHPVRRWWALRAVARCGALRSVVFVCTGNVYRSPFAAKAFLHALPGGPRVDVATGSAGLMGPGRPAPDKARVAAAARGCDLAAHPSRQLTRADLEASDVVVVMEPRQRGVIRARLGRFRGLMLVLGDLDDRNCGERAIPDPWSGRSEEVANAYDRIVRCVRVLARAAEARATSSGGGAGMDARE